MFGGLCIWDNNVSMVHNPSLGTECNLLRWDKEGFSKVDQSCDYETRDILDDIVE